MMFKKKKKERKEPPVNIGKPRKSHYINNNKKRIVLDNQWREKDTDLK